MVHAVHQIRFSRQFMLLSLVPAVLSLSGCGGEPKMDATTPETMKNSIDKVKASLSEADKKRFEDAMQTLALAELNFGDLMKLGAQLHSDPEAIQRRLKDRIHGKTAKQIIAEAQTIAAQATKDKSQFDQRMSDLNAQRKKQLQDAIESYKARQAKVAADAEALKAITVENVKLSWDQSVFPNVEVRLGNGLKSAISAVRFKAKITSPGRTVPWFDGHVWIVIDGGLEPNESQNVKSGTSELSGISRDRTNYLLTLTPVQANGADRTPILMAEPNPFDLSPAQIEQYQKELDSLK